MSIFYNAIGTSNKARKLIIYEGTTVYDGKEYFEMSSSEIYKMRVLKSNASKIIPVLKTKNESFEESYDNFVKLADKIIADTDGRLNLYKTGSLSNTALKLFFEMIGANAPCDPITADEARWINNCNQGAIINQIDYMGDIHNYDINSMYQAILKNKHFKIPTKTGTFVKIPKDEFDKLTFYKFGIYRVEIMTDESYSKLFRFNKNNYYTSFDLTQARSYGLKIHYIECDFNFLYYGANTFENGSILFKEFVDYMYELRKRTGDKVYKTIANSLWGALVQSNLRKLTYSLDDENFNFDFNDDVEILWQVPKSNNKFQICYVKKDKYFKYPFARLKPFILAFGRQMLGRMIEPHIDNIYRIHTDGWSSSKLLDIKLTDEMGGLRYEGVQKNIAIVHVNKIIDLNDVQFEDLDKLAEFFKRYDN